jgi:hypothetical protein
MLHCKPDQPAHRLLEQELDRLKDMSMQNDIAVAAGMYLCANQQVCPPPWLVDAAAKLMIELLKREKSPKKGRAAGRIARYRQDLWDFERWDAVYQVRELRRRTKEYAKELAEHPEYARHYRHVPKAQKWLSQGTFECAAMSLKGSPAYGSPITVKKSYQRVQKAMSSRTTAHRYHLTFDDFVFKVGLTWPGTVRPGTKIVPFWELTP